MARAQGRTVAAPRPSDTLSLAEARRVALAAQGFAERRPTGRIDARHVARVLDRVGLLQIDSVNVLVRSHYLPLFSRLGAYAPELLDRLAYGGRRRALFEYWGHEASLIPTSHHPLFRWRMERMVRGERGWGTLARFAAERGDYVERVLREVGERGPLGVSELTDAGRSDGPWWGWSDGKRALEWLFATGRVTTASRRVFERLYDLPERVLPAEVVAAPTPPEDAAQRALVRMGARAMGVATEVDLRDYFRLPPADNRARIAELVDEGALVPVAIEGLSQPAYLDPAARWPRRIAARALLSPFDSLVWKRSRTERLFGFHYRIGLYTPQHKRTHGYYVLPFLLGDRLVARVDLKADRAACTLRVPAAHVEAGADPAAVAPALAEELRLMAAWLKLDAIAVARRGDLAAPLQRVLDAA